MTEHLNYEERGRLRDAILTLSGGGYMAARPALLDGVPLRVRAIMDQAPSAVLQIALDIIKLNQVDRREDGSIPLLQFMRTVRDLYGQMDRVQAAVLDGLIEKISQQTSGAPVVAPPSDEEIKEAVVHQNDMLPVDFLRLGVAASQSVAKLSITRYDNGQVRMNQIVGEPTVYLGTGWLIAPGLLVTNHHVLNARDRGESAASVGDFALQATTMKVEFDFDDSAIAPTRVGVAEVVHAGARLDYAVVRIDSGTRAPLAYSEALPAAPDGHAAAAVNIIQHPSGQPKRLAIRNNLVASATDEDVRYFTDTDGGSSGSPVFDDNWNVVALHRGSAPASGQFQGKPTARINVGTRISALLADLRVAAAGKAPELNI